MRLAARADDGQAVLSIASRAIVLALQSGVFASGLSGHIRNPDPDHAFHPGTAPGAFVGCLGVSVMQALATTRPRGWASWLATAVAGVYFTQQ